MRRCMWLTVYLLACSLPASADNPFRAVELNDDELAQLRGRYVLPGRIINFGVTMSSTWENSAGQTIGAGVTFQLDGQAQPHISVTELMPNTEGQGQGAAVPPGSGQIVGGGGLTGVQGISQSVRSAGDFNDGLNNLDIVITRGAAGAAEPDAAATPWDGASGFTNAAGNVLVSARNGGLQIHLDAGSQGNALQQIGGGNITQQANFSGDLNTVRNLATLSVALRDLPLGQDMANCTLEQLRALRPGGY
ncbi:hypothetical protein SAMN05216198_1783 [Halopseudomonas litoralis]|uniref:Fap system outer membrane protein n=1 Tax=Halopseudomonas litoralis TaxID=797277 RepID=A0A1H1RL48_9GAMM|nr:hypothetical protein [Halopseudomonas litoralis]SDS36444.1 hypothetical protein SAMN05216198_1783 [Halopseudomonas litoralis]